MEKLFISYNHNDKPLVDTIVRRLELEFGRNNIFYDAWSIQPGDSIIGKMNEGLEEFTTFFFFVSTNSVFSKMVSLEWQTALNKAINNNLKFVAVRIDDCNPPVVLSDKLYIDLYGEGLDSAIEKMKCVIKSESTYKPLDDIQNIKATTMKYSNIIRFIVEADLYAETNPVFAFACSNQFSDFSVCFNISDGMIQSGQDILTCENGMILNAKTVQLQRPLKPGFPFIFEVTINNSATLNNVSLFLLTNSIENTYKTIPLINQN